MSIASWTRAVGACLVLPLVWAAVEDWRARGRDRAALGGVLLALAPVAAFALWRLSPLGRNFAGVEEVFFGRQPLSLVRSAERWGQALLQLWSGRPATRVYYALEVAAVLGGTAACLATYRRMPAVSLFGLAVIAVSVTSGVAQGMHRYVLAVPSVFVALAGLGERSEAFDRGWTTASLLLSGMLATLFTFDFWVA